MKTKIQHKKKMKTNRIEIRAYDASLQSSEDSRTITGLAIPVNSRSKLLKTMDGDFYETVLPEAVTEELIRSNDVKLYLDHIEGKGTFARSKYGEGSLKLFITDRGLEFETEAPNTVFGDALLESIRRGDADSVSFGFIVGEDEWTRNDDGILERSIKSYAMLAEISILTQAPAFDATDVKIRSLEDFQEKERQEAARKDAILKRLSDRMHDINKLAEFY